MQYIFIFLIIFFFLLLIGGLIAGHFEIAPKMQVCPPPEEDEDFLTFKDFFPVITFWLIYVFVAVICSYLLLSKVFNYNPPFSVFGNSSIRNEAIDQSLSKVESEVERLKSIFNNFEDVSLEQAPRVIEDALLLIKNLYEEGKKKERIIKELSKKIEDEKIRAKKAKDIAESFENLKNNQIDHLRILLTEDSRSQSTKSFWYGVLVSLPIGVISSLVAFWFTKRQARRQKKANPSVQATKNRRA